MLLTPSNPVPLKLIAGALLALAVTALKAWPRAPIELVLDGYRQAAASRTVALLHRVPVHTFTPEILC